MHEVPSPDHVRVHLVGLDDQLEATSDVLCGNKIALKLKMSFQRDWILLSRKGGGETFVMRNQVLQGAKGTTF